MFGLHLFPNRRLVQEPVELLPFVRLAINAIRIHVKQRAAQTLLGIVNAIAEALSQRIEFPPGLVLGTELGKEIAAPRTAVAAGAVRPQLFAFVEVDLR